MIDKIPLEQVLNDMYNPKGGLVSEAARTYYYIHYATPEEQNRMDKEEKIQTLFALIVVIGLILFVIMAICDSIV
jgi:hypothetical protein